MNIKVVILIAAIISGCTPNTSAPPTIMLKEVDSSTRLNVVGPPVLVYEFTPETNKTVTCIFAVSGSRKSGLYCIPKQNDIYNMKISEYLNHTLKKKMIFF